MKGYVSELWLYWCVACIIVQVYRWYIHQSHPGIVKDRPSIMINQFLNLSLPIWRKVLQIVCVWFCIYLNFEVVSYLLRNARFCFLYYSYGQSFSLAWKSAIFVEPDEPQSLCICVSEEGFWLETLNNVDFRLGSGPPALFPLLVSTCQ